MFQVTCEELTVWEHMSGYPKYLLDQILFWLCPPFWRVSAPQRFHQSLQYFQTTFSITKNRFYVKKLLDLHEQEGAHYFNNHDWWYNNAKSSEHARETELNALHCCKLSLIWFFFFFKHTSWQNSILISCAYK